ncbi:unnamed protein product [Pneumocystis jirovecii]|uniref:Midasin n=1 Tax=Pneumocystis jirovecii TaxID=42068 RepID=L0PEL4_PNEJI|nr:unnamed protein product [Pneumocystis jirovecii]
MMGENSSQENEEMMDYELAASELVLLCKLPEEIKKKLTSEPLSNAVYLDTIACLLLDPDLTLVVAELYYPVLSSLVSRWDAIKNEKAEEIACAFAKLLPLAPSLKPYALRILCPFLSFSDISGSICSTKNQYERPGAEAFTSELLLAAYRLIIFDPVLFSPFISISYIWPCLYHQVPIVRFLALEILCILLSLSDEKRKELVSFYVGQGPVDYLYFGKIVDFSFFLLLENDLKMNFLDKVASRNYFSTNRTRIIHDSDQSHLVVPVCGINLPKLNFLNSTNTDFVITPSSQKNLKNFAKMLLSQKPVLLLGPFGSGKTFIVESITKMLGNYDSLVRIYIGDQIDLKSLIGTYVIGSKPGIFDWKPDIDKAPNEIIGVLLPLLENNELEISSRGEKVTAAYGFQIIATISINTHQNSNIKFLGSRLWQTVDFCEIPIAELPMLVCSKFQILKKLSHKIIEVYEAVFSIYSDPVFHSESKIAFGRVVSIRDLMKWCKRIAIFLSNGRIVLEDNYISQDIIDNMFYNAVDCFSGMIQTSIGKFLIVQKIAQTLGYLSTWTEKYIKSYIPIYEDSDNHIKIGRAYFQKCSEFIVSRFKYPFAFTSSVLRLLEQLGVSVESGEHVLLVGETGTGKTTTVQYLANILGHELIVINMSQQTENADLLGGFKPIDLKTISISLKDQFDNLFSAIFPRQKNYSFLEAIRKAYSSKKWKYLIRLFKAVIDTAQKRISSVFDNEKNDEISDVFKKRRRFGPELKKKLETFSEDVSKFETYVLGNSESFVFGFVEGPLIKAIRNGSWILLDEINLAEFGILENISGILQEKGSILLSEKGDIDPIYPHPNFRLFACMNPSTDIGRRDLSLSLRSRFTEFFVHSPDQSFDDLFFIIHKYIGHLTFSDEKVLYDVAQLHLKAKQLENENLLVDSAGQKPHYNIRTLTRTLMYVNEICQLYELRRSLYEGFCMLYLTLLEKSSEEILHLVIKQYTVDYLKNLKSSFAQIPKRPLNGNYIQFKHYWMHKGDYEIEKDNNYIITQSVEKNMLNLIRATATGKFPILLQGPTSSGKTSMVEYIAKLTGHKFVRINNHEHIDLQEYLGAYISDNFGNLKFKEGVMVEALRNGYWIVLDELNLAPSEVLEALNRLLDDNRELLITETQEIVKPHPHFMLFATQNPPGIYSGRKYLSRAFRNRFLELHYDSIPENELETILCTRCRIPPSYAMKMVQVYKKLSLQRQSSMIFQQKSSFMTLRDLFRWASRNFSTYQEFVNNGYMLLGERVRRNDEKIIVKEIIEAIMKVKISENELYYINDSEECSFSNYFPNLDGIVWTNSMKRLFRLVSLALENNEPVLLVGETGTGKTSICQAISKSHSSFLHIVNVHQNIESSDIIGTQRPIRNKDEICKRLYDNISKLLAYIDSVYFDNIKSTALLDLIAAFSNLEISDIKENSKGTIYYDIINSIEKDLVQYKKMFDWCDGALVKAMKSGEYFLLDEISLASDSVLERLNSVLEPSRTITLAEKSVDENLIKAKDGFKFMATMNPGGDYGKKELSPALRNRFTEIWVPSIFEKDDILKIVRSKLKNDFCEYSEILVSFSFWFQQNFSFYLSRSLSIRDILLWVDYMNLPDIHSSITHYILHGASLVYIDKIGVNSGLLSKLTTEQIQNKRLESVNYLSSLVGENLQSEFLRVPQITIDKEILKIGSFSFRRGPYISDCSSYSLCAPITSFNAMRILRAMQLSKPILLEGSPGIGKTSLVSTIASISGFPLTRINLSEQTDLMDLFGSDLPVDGEAIEFAWHDGPFLRAMKNGHWVLLDEMNLAPQSILEGLNACFDHRAQVFVPELNQTFVCHPSFRVFAAQNPHSQGGGRKGLPKSFINRFIVVHIEKMSFEDLLSICDYIFPHEDLLIKKKIISFIERLNSELSLNCEFGMHGSPWEFNLRDILRWLEILEYGKLSLHGKCPSEFLDIIVKQRFRTIEDQKIVDEIYQKVFGNLPTSHNLYYSLSTNFFQVGYALLPRNSILNYNKNSFFNIFKNQLKVIESLIFCIKFNWPCILVGPPASGKTSLVRFISFISGAKLVEFSVNNDIDTMDIIGGFEQVDLILKLNKFITNVQEFCKSKLRFLLVSSQEKIVEHVTIYNRILQLIEIQGRQTVSDYRKLLSDIVLLFTELSNLSIAHDSLFHQIFQKLKKYVLVDDTYKPTQFEWIDSVLVQAVENGEWLLLDNVNLCNSSVLDRLNSLMEPEGKLILNERSSLDGKPFIINSHPNFRIILTMDPANGELSRAMRNRCVEIFCDKLQTDNQIESIVMHSVTTCNDSILFSSLPSFMFNHFHLYGKVLKKYYSEKNMPILGDLFLEHIPIKQIDLLKRWYSSYIIDSGMFLQIRKDIISNLIYKSTEFQKSFLYQKIYDFYKDLIYSSSFPEDFADSQPLYPLVNPYIKNIILSSLSDLSSSRTYLRIILETIQGKSQCVSNMNMTVLEKSCLNLHSDETATLLHINVFQFLSSLLNEIKLLLIRENFDYVNQEFTESIMHLIDIWHHIYEFTNVQFIDYSKYHVYNSNLQIWNQEYGSLLPDDSRKRFDQLIRLFNLNFKFKTGFSMEIIWKKVKPELPKFEYTWTIYKELVSCMNKFDHNFQYNAYISNIVLNIRSLFLENCYSIFTVSNIGEISSKIDSFQINFKIENFLKDLQNNMNKIGLHNDTSIRLKCFPTVLNSFNVIFSCLEGFVINHVLEHGFISKDIYDMILSSHMWTNRSSISLIPYIIAHKGISENGSLVFQIFDSYFSTTTRCFLSSECSELLIESFPAFLFFGKPIKTIAGAIYNIKNALFENFEQMKSSLSDLTLQVFQHTWYIKNDKISFIFEIFIEKFVQIFDIHKSLYCSSDYQIILTNLKKLKSRSYDNQKESIKILEELKEKFQKTDHLKLRKIINIYFIPSLLIIFPFVQNPEATESELLSKLGKAFIFFELGFLYLYVPNIPYDPAIFPIVQIELHKKRLEYISSEICLRKLYEKEFTGCNDNISIRNLQLRYQDLESKKIIFPHVYRPSISEIVGIYREFEKLLQMFIVDHSLENIIKSFENKEIDAIFHLTTIQKTTCQLIDRLESYLYYTDILKPICGSLKVINFSLVLIKQAEQFSKSTSEDLTMKIFLNLFDINTILTEPLNITFIKLFLNQVSCYKCDSVFVDRFMIFCLKKLSFFKKHSFLNDFSNYIEIVDYIFQYFYSKWILERDEEIKLALEKESIYKISHSEDDDYRTLFPEFEIFDEFKKYESLKTKGKGFCRIELMKIHKKLFNDFEPVVSCFELVNSALNLGIELLILDNFNINSRVNEIVLPSLIYYMKDVFSDSNFVLPIYHDSDDWLYNFYKDPNIKESVKLGLTLKDLNSKVQRFLEEWPENSILHEIITRLDIILKSGIEMPLVQSLIALEQLYSVVDQWKSIASSEYSLDTNIEDLKKIIIKWRKLELNCWNDLFKLEDKEKYNEMTDSWFYLYENIIYRKPSSFPSTNDLENYINELVSLLDQFITSSSLGQFEERLKLIDAFSSHLFILGKTEFIEKRILLALKNLVALYSLYIPKIRNTIYEGKIPLEESIKNTIQSMSWKDTNVFVLKESARKSHRSLYKVVKKYRELLSVPSLSILVESYTESLRLTSQNSITFCGSLELELVTVNEELLKWSLNYFKSVNFVHRLNASYRHRSILNTVRNMWFLIIQKYGQDSTSDENPFELFTTNIVENMKELQDLTSSMASDKKSEINYLKIRKKKLFSDTLNELKRIGLKTNPNVSVIKKVSNINNLLTTIPYYDIKMLKDQNHSSFIRIIDDYFFRFITFITKIRQSQNEHSSDISINEISRSLGLLNSLFYMILLERSSLIKVLFEIYRFEKKLSVLSLLQTMVFEENSSFLKNYRKNKYIYDRFESFLSHIQSIVTILENIRNIHASSISSPLLDELGKDFDLISEESKKFGIEFKYLGGLDRIVMDKTAGIFVSDFMKWMENISKKMFSYSSQPTSCAYLAIPIFSWIKNTMNFLKLIHLEVLENDYAEVVIESDIFMRNLSDKILLIIQNLADVKSLDVKHDSNGILEDSWLIKKHAFFLNSINILEMEDINSLLEKSISEINKLNMTGFSDIHTLLKLKAVYCLSIPILEQYLIICKYMLEKFICYHKSMAKSALLFSIVLNTLIEKGFCTPLETNVNEKNATVSESTGLADDNIGNVTENLNENFEGFDETNSEKNNFENSGNNIEVNDDFSSISESSDDSQGIEDFDDKTLDDEINDVDRQNSTIDQKFWDQENNESMNLDSIGNQKLDDNENDMGLVAQEPQEDPSITIKKNHDMNDNNDNGISDNDEILENFQESKFNNDIENIEPLSLPDDVHLDVDDNDDIFNNDLDLDQGESKHDELDYEESDYKELSHDESDYKELSHKESECKELNREESECKELSHEESECKELNHEESECKELNHEELDNENSFNVDGNCQSFTDLSKNVFVENNSIVLDESFYKEYKNNENISLEAKHNSFIRNLSNELVGNNDIESWKNYNDIECQKSSNNSGMDKEFEPIRSLNDSYKSLGNMLKEWNKIINNVFHSKDHDDLSSNNFFKNNNEYEYMKDIGLNEDTNALVLLPEKQEKSNFDMEDNLDEINSHYNDKSIEKSSDSFVDTGTTNIENSGLEILDAEVGCQKNDIRHNMNDIFLQNMTDLHEKILDNNNSSDLPDFKSDSSDFMSNDDAIHLWKNHEESVHDLSIYLSEQLKLILEPTLATKMQGDYRTGKRLNMRRIIPYIASQYRKDKIWMRRTKPGKRQYQVMICIDDSKSMAESGSINLTFETLAVISKALSLLEVGEICIMSFGDKPSLIHSFKEPFTSESGAKLIKKFRFNQSRTDVKALTETSIKIFETAKNTLHFKSSMELWQLEIIVSDGIYEDHDSLRRLLRKAYELKIMVIFVIVDVIYGKKTTSLLDMKQARYKTALDGSTTLEIINYMDEFAFDHFVIVRDVKELAHVLANALRQWFMEVSQS